MLRVETTIGTESHIPFSWADTGQTGPEAKTRRVGSNRGLAARELNLSGYQLLFGSAFLMGFATFLLWVFKLWLLEP